MDLEIPLAYPLALKYIPFLTTCFHFDQHESMSVVDDVTRKLRKKSEKVAPDKKLLFRSIMNCAINQAKSKKRHTRMRTESGLDLIESRRTHEEIDDIAGTVAELTGVTPDDDECTILRMLALEGATFDMIGRKLNISPGAARQRLYQYRQRCRARLKRSA